MDIFGWYAPESLADCLEPKELGRVGHDGGLYTPDQVRTFADQLLELADVAERAGQSAYRAESEHDYGYYPEN